MEQLVFDFLKENDGKNKTKFAIYNEEEKSYPFNIFFNSEEEALSFLTLRMADGSKVVLDYFYKIHRFKLDS